METQGAFGLRIDRSDRRGVRRCTRDERSSEHDRGEGVGRSDGRLANGDSFPTLPSPVGVDAVTNYSAPPASVSSPSPVLSIQSVQSLGSTARLAVKRRSVQFLKGCAYSFLAQ